MYIFYFYYSIKHINFNLKSKIYFSNYMNLIPFIIKFFVNYLISKAQK